MKYNCCSDAELADEVSTRVDVANGTAAAIGGIGSMGSALM